MPAGASFKKSMDSSILSSVEWTAELALRAARVDADLPRPDQEAQVQTRIDNGELPPEAINALRKSGYDVKHPAANSA